MHQIVVRTDGSLRTLFSDDLPIRDLGKVAIRRASHVEPTEDGHWTADLSPSGGETLGPFERRADALEAEANWLRAAHRDRP